VKKRTSVTQKEIAKRAGVSQTVVSLALNNSYDVMLSEETRQRVLDVAADLGYVPQAAAKSLVQGRSNNIGLVLVRPHYQVFRDPFIPNVITGLTEVVRAQGFRLLVEHIDDLHNLRTIPNLLKGGEVAGMVLSSAHGFDDVIAPLIDQGYPIILIDDVPGKACSVSLDHAGGVSTAAHHIANLRRSPIGCITFAPMNPHVDSRLRAFKSTLEQEGFVLEDRYLAFGDYDPDSGYAAMQSLLALSPHPQVIFGMNDMMALGAIRAILDAGLRVPEDIAVVGYDDMRFAEFTNPPLTTIRAPEVELGRVAGKVLIDLIHGEVISERQLKLKTELIVRGSCGGN